MAVDRLREWVGRLVVAVLAVAPAAAVLLAPGFESDETVTLRGTMPEQGGWQPGALNATAGRPLRLRVTSGDVVHSFAIGHSELEPVEVRPGQVTEVTLRFDRPGTYTFYCTRWCGPNHWRMRGTIEVSGPGAVPDSTPPAPYLALGLDLDAPHPAEPRPELRPSATRDEQLRAGVPMAYLARDYVRRHSPAAVWRALRGESALRGLTDAQRWDLVAWIWWRNAGSEALETGRRLYALNCSACHGRTGRGDGVMAPALFAALHGPGAHAVSDSEPARAAGDPADFTDPDLLGASPALLHGKIVRGGMGTGMPYWGPVLTDAEVWALVDYLYGFQFTYDAGRRR